MYARAALRASQAQAEVGAEEIRPLLPGDVVQLRSLRDTDESRWMQTGSRLIAEVNVGPYFGRCDSSGVVCSISFFFSVCV